MPCTPEVRITRPVNQVRKKVLPMDEAAFKKLLRDAEAGAAQLCADYAQAVGVAAARLNAMADEAMNDPACRSAKLGEIADLAFELRGEGGSFGFDIVSLVADSLFRLSEDMASDVDDLCLKVVQMHAQALNALLAGGVRKPEDAMSKQILKGLVAARTKATAYVQSNA